MKIVRVLVDPTEDAQVKAQQDGFHLESTEVKTTTVTLEQWYIGLSGVSSRGSDSYRVVHSTVLTYIKDVN